MPCTLHVCKLEEPYEDSIVIIFKACGQDLEIQKKLISIENMVLRMTGKTLLCYPCGKDDIMPSMDKDACLKAENIITALDGKKS